MKKHLRRLLSVALAAALSASLCIGAAAAVLVRRVRI